MPDERYEYMEIDCADLDQLDALGAEGWYPASDLRFKNARWDVPSQEYTDYGWCGLMMRLVREDDDDVPT